MTFKAQLLMQKVLKQGYGAPWVGVMATKIMRSSLRSS